MYNPTIWNNQGIAPGLNMLSNVLEARGGILGMIEADRRKKQEEKQKDATNQAVFHTLLNATDSSGNPLVSADEKALFQAGDLQQRTGVVAGLLFRADQANNAAQRDLQWKIAKLRNAQDPNVGHPQPMMLPDGTVIPNRFYVPGANQIIDTSRSTNNGGPPAGLNVPPGWVWNGRELVQQRSQQQDDSAQLEALNRRRQLASLDQEIANAQGEVAAGNTRPGPDWLPFSTPYSAQIKKLQSQRQQLSQQGTATSDTGKIHVRHPNGQSGWIPANQLQDALANGYQQIP